VNSLTMLRSRVITLQWSITRPDDATVVCGWSANHGLVVLHDHRHWTSWS